MSKPSQPCSVAPSALSAEFNAIVRRIDDQVLHDAMANPMTRAVVVGAVFAEMPHRARVDKIAGVDAVLCWRIGGDVDWTVVIDHGSCTVRPGNDIEDSTVTLELGTVPFLRMIAGQTTGMALLLTGKLRVKGSLMVARHLEEWFVRD